MLQYLYTASAVVSIYLPLGTVCTTWQYGAYGAVRFCQRSFERQNRTVRCGSFSGKTAPNRTVRLRKKHIVKSHGSTTAGKDNILTYVMLLWRRLADTPSPAPSRGGVQGNLASHTVLQWHRTLCVIFYYFYFLVLVLLCVFSLVLPPHRGTVGSVTFPFRVGCRLISVSSPLATLAVRGRFLTLVSLAIAPAFSFNRLSSSRPPPHAGGPRGGLGGGFPYYSTCL